MDIHLVSIISSNHSRLVPTTVYSSPHIFSSHAKTRFPQRYTDKTMCLLGHCLVGMHVRYPVLKFFFDELRRVGVMMFKSLNLYFKSDIVAGVRLGCVGTAEEINIKHEFSKKMDSLFGVKVHIWIL